MASTPSPSVWTACTASCWNCRDELGTLKIEAIPGARFCTLECMTQYVEMQDPRSGVDEAYRQRWIAQKRAGRTEAAPSSPMAPAAAAAPVAPEVTSSGPAAMPEELYEAGKVVYQQFVQRVKSLLRIDRPDFGLVVLKPSELLEYQVKLADGTPEQRTSLIDLIESTNGEIKQRMEAGGCTATQFYIEFNRRGVEAGLNAGPRSWTEADGFYRARGARLMASFRSTPQGKLFYTGLVPSALLLRGLEKTVNDFLPDEREKAYLRANPTKAVNTYVALPSEQAFNELYSKAVKFGSTAGGVPLIILPSKMFEEEVASFDIGAK
jgi:hypothetical protein